MSPREESWMPRGTLMACPDCASTATTRRKGRTALGYRRFRCQACRRRFNERTGTPFNDLQYPTDIVLLAVLWRLRYKLGFRDVAELLLQRGFEVTHETIRAWEVRFAPLLDNALAESVIGLYKPESTDGLGCAGCRARNGRLGGCGSGWWRWQGATVAVRACGQEETAVGRRSQACWRQAVERSARPSGVRSGAGSPAAGRGRR